MGLCALAHGLGAQALPGRIGSVAPRGALPASVPLEDSAGFVSEDTRGLLAVARSAQAISRAEGGGDFARSRLSRRHDSPRAGTESEEEFSSRRGGPDFGRRALSCVS